MNLIPEIGLVVWTAFIFIVLLIVLRAFAWKPILAALNERENSISESLKAAEAARDEMASLKEDNEKLLASARAERDLIIKEAQASAESFKAEQMAKAGEDVEQFIAKSKSAFESEKNAAIASLRKEAASLSVDLAEKILRKELENKAAQEALLSEYLKEANITA